MSDRHITVTWQQGSYETDPAPEWMLARWRARGMPEEAIRPDGTVRVEVLRLHGWDIVDGWVMGPPVSPG